MSNDPKNFRAHRITTLAGLEADEVLNDEWVTYVDAANTVMEDQRGCGKLHPGLRIRWHIEERQPHNNPP